jgi:hypothetical protein
VCISLCGRRKSADRTQVQHCRTASNSFYISTEPSIFYSNTFIAATTQKKKKKKKGKKLSIKNKKKNYPGHDKSLSLKQHLQVGSINLPTLKSAAPIELAVLELLR